MATDTMEPLAVEIQAYERQRAELEQKYMGKFVVFKGEDFVGAWHHYCPVIAAAHPRKRLTTREIDAFWRPDDIFRRGSCAGDNGRGEAGAPE